MKSRMADPFGHRKITLPVAQKSERFVLRSKRSEKGFALDATVLEIIVKSLHRTVSISHDQSERVRGDHFIMTIPVQDEMLLQG